MRFVKSEPDETISTGKEGEDGYRKLDNFEYPQVNSVEEAVTAAGNEKTLVDWMNGHFEKDSKNVGRVALRGVDSKADETTAYAKIRDLIRNWSPKGGDCLLYTSPSPRDRQKSRMPS